MDLKSGEFVDLFGYAEKGILVSQTWKGFELLIGAIFDRGPNSKSFSSIYCPDLKFSSD